MTYEDNHIQDLNILLDKLDDVYRVYGAEKHDLIADLHGEIQSLVHRALQYSQD